MKIAVLQDDFPPYHEGGTGIIAYQLAKGFSQRGHEVLVIASTQDSTQIGKTHVDGLPIVRLFSKYHERYRAYRSLYNPSVVGEVSKLLQEFAPDVVHVHNVHLHLSYYSIVLARRYARRVCMTAHDAMSFSPGKLPLGENVYRESAWLQFKTHKWRYNPLRNMIIYRILRHGVDKIIAVSEALGRALAANGIGNVEVIHNGINADEWKEPPDVESFKTARGMRESALLFGGRLSRAKGALKMVEILAKVAEAVPDAQLLIIGKKDSHADDMISLARSLGVEEKLVFTGWVTGDDLRRAYWASAVVVVPSLYLDPFPTINLEAFACAKPVVATTLGGSPEIVKDGVSGYVVNPFEIAAMAEKIAELLLDLQKNKEFGQAGYESVTKEFSLQNQIAAYEELFKSHR